MKRSSVRHILSVLLVFGIGVGINTLTAAVSPVRAERIAYFIADGQLAVFDTDDFRFEGFFGCLYSGPDWTLGLSIRDIAVTPDGGSVYVAVSDSGSVGVPDGAVYVFDSKTMHEEARIDFSSGSIVISPNGTYAYAASYLLSFDGEIAVIDTATNQISGATIPVGRGIHDLAISPDGRFLYVAGVTNSSPDDDFVGVIDTVSRTVVATVPVARATKLAVTPDGTLVFVTSWSSPYTITVIDTATYTVAATLPVSGPTRDIAITPDGALAFVLGWQDTDSVFVIDVASLQIQDAIALDSPYGVAFDPEGVMAYVSHATSLSLVDIETSSIVKTIDLGVRAPNTITFNPAPILLDAPSMQRFSDVCPSYWAYSLIQRFAASGLTGGCTLGRFCPYSTVTRGEIAVLLVRGIHGSTFEPPPATGTTFLDVDADEFAADFIEQLYVDGITNGCGGGNFCPAETVTRAQMAVFVERSMRGSDFIPPPATGTVFYDVDVDSFAANFIEQLYADGITSGCFTGAWFCSRYPTTRTQMAVFLARAFDL
jgi:YVTN family beta-propeller protein